MTKHSNGCGKAPSNSCGECRSNCKTITKIMNGITKSDNYS
ncbi:hypothetical protein X975_22224, partial [Stegodyphus mimosarum]